MINIRDNVYWIGFRDFDAKTFHGHEMSTPNGTSYNSYYIHDEKNAIIDSAKANKKEEYLKTIKEEIGFENIDVIISNHAEPDHSGSLGALLKEVRDDVLIYCTKNGKKFLSKMFGENHNYRVVKTNDSINLGKTELVFVEMTMIHWPDSMMTYVKNSKILLSNDAFGQHITNGSIFDKDINQCDLEYETLKYYVNILTPFSTLIKKKLEEIDKLNLDIDFIAPSHGVVWSEDIEKPISWYKKWSNNYNDSSVVIIYDTMYETSLKMAEAIGKGLEKENVNYVILNASTYDTSDLFTKIFKSSGVIMGGPTLNNGILTKLAGILEEMKSMKFKNKQAAAFGTYGWSGESADKIKKGLIDANFKVKLEPIKVMLTLSKEEYKKCIEYGREFAKLIVKDN